MRSVLTISFKLRNITEVLSASSPRRLLPLLEVSVSEGELVQLGEQVVRDVLLVSVLRPEDELDSLRRRVCGDATTNPSSEYERVTGATQSASG